MSDGPTNEGARLLAARLSERGLLQQDIAAQTGVEESSVSRWVRCRMKPKTAQRMWLQEHLDIPWQSWDQEPTEPALARTGTDDEVSSR